MSQRETRAQQLRRHRARVELAAMKLAAILDEGERDPTWHESQELENSALELGRFLNARRS